MKKRTMVASAGLVVLAASLAPVTVEAKARYFSQTRTVVSANDGSTPGEATCPPGWKVVSGGWQDLPANETTDTSLRDYTIVSSYPSSSRTWTVSANVRIGERNTDTGEWFIKGFAYYPTVVAQCIR